MSADRDAGCVIALVGAESTGKTALAAELAAALERRTGKRCTWVPEWLRLWCDREGRTPLPQEQEAIAREQIRLIEAAQAEHDIVVADTTALMTAVYSHMLFGDASLREMALAAQRRYAITLLTDNDLPWQADGHQRDGPHVREPVSALLRLWLNDGGVSWHAIRGTGPARLAHALQACEHWG